MKTGVIQGLTSVNESEYKKKRKKGESLSQVKVSSIELQQN